VFFRASSAPVPRSLALSWGYPARARGLKRVGNRFACNPRCHGKTCHAAFILSGEQSVAISAAQAEGRRTEDKERRRKKGTGRAVAC